MWKSLRTQEQGPLSNTPQIQLFNLRISSPVRFVLEGRATFADCHFHNWVFINLKASRVPADNTSSLVGFSESGESATDAQSADTVNFQRCKFEMKLYVDVRDTESEFVVSGCNLKEVELSVGMPSRFTLLQLRISDTVLQKTLSIVSRYDLSITDIYFKNVRCHGGLSIENAGNYGLSLHLRKCRFFGNDDKAPRLFHDDNLVTLEGVSTVKVQNSVFWMIRFFRIVGRQRCCSTIVVSNSKFVNSRLHCIQGSLAIKRTKFSSQEGDCIFWENYQQSRFLLSNTKLALTRYAVVVLCSVRNFVMKNVTIICPLKITLGNEPNSKYRIMCAASCSHDEYKMSGNAPASVTLDVSRLSPLSSVVLENMVTSPSCPKCPLELYAVRAIERVPAGSCHFSCFTDPSQLVASFLCIRK